jgi:hypothetical protein
VVRVEGLSDKEDRAGRHFQGSPGRAPRVARVRLNPTQARTRFSILLGVAHDSKSRNNYNTINDEAVTLAKLLYSVAQVSL